MEKEIRTIMIFEIMGRPESYIKESIEKFSDKIGQEKDVKIINKKTAEVKKIEGQELFTTFAELEIETKDISALLRIIFNYMPSHIEIVSPDEFRLKNFDFGSILTEIIRIIHKYDEMAKIMMFERQALEGKIKELEAGVKAPENNSKNKAKKTKKKK